MGSFDPIWYEIPPKSIPRQLGLPQGLCLAGWHTSSQLRIPDGVHLIFQPPYSPELQPVERVWTLLNEPIANRTFRDLDELEDVAVHRCRQLAANNDLIRRHTCFYWWKEAL